MKKKLKCCVCHKEINEEEARVFKNQIAHSGECLRSIIDKYNTNRRLEIENKRLKAEIEKLQTTVNDCKQENDKLFDKIKAVRDYVEEMCMWLEKGKKMYMTYGDDLSPEHIIELLEGDADGSN